MEVTSFKLVSGEEVIARVDERTDDLIVLDRPMAIGLGQTKDGMAVQLMPWLASNQEGIVKIYPRHVVAETIPHSELEAGYIKQTSLIAMAVG